MTEILNIPASAVDPTKLENAPKRQTIIAEWDHPILVAESNFQAKSLCEWSVNTAIGCGHGCRFCYVPSTSVNKQGVALKKLGVDDPDAQWGGYVFPRKWDEAKFRKSLLSAENKPLEKLAPDGNRAVMFSSTTDPYQVIGDGELHRQHQENVTRALTIIRDESTLNVRILTRSPLAKKDFDLMKSFGKRLLFGMSLPTLNNTLARIYEPYSPAPTQRLATLQAAKEAGLNVYVAVAPTYPECDETDLRATMAAIAKLEPLTVYHEPINIRAENVERIEAHAKTLGLSVKTAVFADEQSWAAYTIEQLRLMEKIAAEVGLAERLHLWPDKALAKSAVIATQDDPTAFVFWLQGWWSRVSEWPA